MMLSDCRSLVANLNTKVPSRVPDKRLQVELDAIRQWIFDSDGRRTAEVYSMGGDRVDWVATTTQIAWLPHKEHEANLHAQSSGHMQVPDLIRRVLQTQRKSRGHCTYRAGRARVGPNRTCSRRVGNVDVTRGKTTREQVGCEHLPVSQSCVVTCCS